ncbi:MAG: PKD domain-containing protein [Holophagaceae bacterium]|nr:PKD domain-containing protein [Holophagaceae bacterium]
MRPLPFLSIVLGSLALLAALACGGASASKTAAPVAAFTVSPGSPIAGQDVTFTDATTGSPTTWSWSFGDGVTSSVQNPSHTFAAAGTYAVSLTATNAGGSHSASRSVTVAPAGTFTLASSAVANGGALPIDYTTDGSGASPDLTWGNAPAGTKAFALLLSTLPGDGTTLYNWVLYNIPAQATGLARNSSGGATAGASGHTLTIPATGYAPPQSEGPGTKTYTFTVYALSGNPSLPADPSQVTGAVLSQAISGMTLGTAKLEATYARQAPTAAFTAATKGLTVTFTNASGLSATGWSWNFGDGTTSTDPNPVHTYATAGNYAVSLTATNAFGTSSPSTRTVTPEATSAPVAGYSYLSASGSSTLLRSGHAIRFTDTTVGVPSSWSWTFGDGTTSTEQNPVHIFAVPAAAGPDNTQSFTVSLTAGNALGTSTKTQTVVVHQPEFNLYQGISDEAQSKTVSFSGFALLTGNLNAQTFFPPGKVADYTGFQYLRDNDPSGMGHNTSFVTRVACNVINILTTDQLNQLATLATSQAAGFRLYGYKRYTLMKAFRRLQEGDLPTGTTGLNVDTIKAYSNALYQIDGQISYDRALLYASIIKGMSPQQLDYLDAMKGRGWANWPDVTMDTVRNKMSTLPKDVNVLVMTYAGDIYSWYAGSVEADVYFCPERHGTYYGGFYMKDAPAIGHEGYSISTTLTAEAGGVLLGLDSSNKSAIGKAPYFITQSQADLMAGLATTQKSNLWVGSTNIVSIRTQIATLLRSLLLPGTDASAVKSQVLALSGTYGELDGENNYNYAKVFAAFGKSLSTTQTTALQSLRSSIMKGTYADGTAFDFTNCTTYYLYSDIVTSADIANYVDPLATAPLFK